VAETIVMVAIKFGDLITAAQKPERHHHIFYRMSIGDVPFGSETQGFITSTGRFVDREEARTIAISANQNNLVERRPIHSRELFSEDLW
jgi:hypothetical protein